MHSSYLFHTHHFWAFPKLLDSPGPPDASGHRAVHFTQLRATSHQLMALLAALAPSMSAVVVLGGGGMALPIAMLAAGYAGRVHVVELHPKAPRWRVGAQGFGYESIPINTIFRGMNIHLPAILMFTRGTRFWHTAISVLEVMFFFGGGNDLQMVGFANQLMEHGPFVDDWWFTDRKIESRK